VNTTGYTALDAVNLVVGQAQGLRCYLTGSAASAADKEVRGVHGFEKSWHDVDLFVGSENEWVRSIQFLIDRGYEFCDRMEMLWFRVLHYGTKNWHTNSMRLTNPEGIEVNVIYKTQGRHPTSSLSQVIETFDFGLLSLGWETETGTFRDARSYQFPGLDIDGPLPLLPWRREQIKLGHFREHQGLRTFGRVQRYFDEYGYDGDAVLPDIVDGYSAAAGFYLNRTKPEHLVLGRIYENVAMLIEAKEWAKVKEASDLLPKMDIIDELYDLLIEP
jgi:hypothetical protein